MNYLKLIRFPNLLMILVVQCMMRYSIFMIEDLKITLSTLGFIFLVLTTLLIAAGGYIINDVFDITADKINKPKKRIVAVRVSEKQAKLTYFILTFTGLGLGFILTNLMAMPFYFIFFIVSAALLYIYASSLRKYALLGNMIIGFLVGLSTLLVAIFELLPAVTELNVDDQMGAFYIFLTIAVFATALTLIREVVKDTEDIQGDHVAGYKTLPIILGAQRSVRISAILTLITITGIAWHTFTFLYDYKVAVAAIFFGILAPLGYCSSKLWEATKKSELSQISLLLKIIMLLGICMIPLVMYTFYYA